jgi:DNA-binding MarR family transcriptional regulator
MEKKNRNLMISNEEKIEMNTLINQNQHDQDNVNSKDSDFVDYIIKLWNMHDIQPGDAIAIYLRLSRLTQHIAHLETIFRAEPNGLNLNELQMLLAIRRSGTKGKISPSALKEALLVSPSAISKQIERLRKKGYVERIIDDEDRRSVWVRLTEAGTELLNSIVSMRDHTEVIGKLTKEEQLVLNQLLRKLLIFTEEYFEDSRI